MFTNTYIFHFVGRNSSRTHEAILADDVEVVGYHNIYRGSRDSLDDQEEGVVVYDRPGSPRNGYNHAGDDDVEYVDAEYAVQAYRAGDISMAPSREGSRRYEIAVPVNHSRL